jgi:transcriptional regulator with XRE-family HTH domain
MITTVARVQRKMLRMTQIHSGKTPHRIHYIPEWAAKRNMRQADVVRAFPAEMNVNKSTVSRWFNGTVPEPQHLVGLAEIFKTEVSALFRHPDDDWIAKFFRDQAIEVLKAMFRNSRGTGTNG